MLRSLALAVVLALALPAAAPAASRLVDTGVRQPYPVGDPAPFAGPVLVPGGVAWATRDRTGPLVAADRPDGRRVVDRLPATAEELVLASGPDRLAVLGFRIACPDEDDPESACSRYRGEYPIDFVLRAGPPDGPLAPFGNGCATVAADAVRDAVVLDCSPSIVVERDGPARRLPFPSPQPRLAGDLLSHALTTAPAGTENGVVVEDRRSGGERLRVLTPVTAHDLAPDGLVAIAVPDRPVLLLASPSAPTPREVALPAPAVDVRLGGDRIAVRLAAGASGARFLVLDRDGRPVADHISASARRGWDFDGERLTWAQRPCARVAVAEWPVDEAPPGDLPGACGLPVVAAPRLRVGADRRLALPLRCPGTATGGCVANVSTFVAARNARGRVVRADALPLRLVLLDRGERRVLSRRLGRGELRRLRGLRRLRLDVRAGPVGVPGPVAGARVPLRVR
jgi:hypothetical protein